MNNHSSRQKARKPAENGAGKRERILDAAVKVFAQEGFYNAKVSQIAHEAGVADGTIYLYFKNKDDLLISLFESRMERVTAELGAALERVGPRPADRLTGFFATYAQLVVAHPELAEVLTVELRQSSKFRKEYQNPRFSDFLKLLAGLIADGQEQGEFDRSLPPPIAARAIFGMLDELALAWLLGRGEKFDIVRAADALGALVLRGLERRST